MDNIFLEFVKLTCPKCGFPVFHEIIEKQANATCRNCRHTFAWSNNIAKPNNMGFDPFFMEKIKPIDVSMYIPPISWLQRVGHADFPPDLSWERDMEKLKKLLGE